MIRFALTVGLIGAGALLVVHLRRGGEMTLASVGATLRTLRGTARTGARDLRQEVETRVVHEVASTLARATEPTPAR